MLARIAGFEFRYQLRNPVFWVTAGLFFLLTFGAMTVDQIRIGSGGNVHGNAPVANVEKMLIMSLFFMFVTTAFVANVIVRDDDTGYGPIVRSTRVTKFDYLFGRFLGALAIAALCFLSVPLAIWIGAHMPWLDPDTLGPNRFADLAIPYLALALPNIIVTSAIFFALATATRSMMATYVGVVAFLVFYFVVNVALRDQPQLQDLRAMLEPFGFGAVGKATRYWTAAERNSMLPPLGGLLLWNRLLWLGLAAFFLAVAYGVYRFSDKPQSKRRARRQAREAALEAAPAVSGPLARLPAARFDGATARAQLSARTRLEMRQVFRSPAFVVLMTLGLFNAFGGMWFSGEIFGTPVHPVTRALIPILEGTFTIIPLIVAIYYAGELVWRERDRKMHEIVDATPLPNWAYVVPKTLAVSLVLLSSVAISVLAAMLFQLIKGYADLEPGKYLLWYILPQSVDMVIIAALAVFIQALSPNKYAGWGLMVLYLVLTIVAGNLGLQHSLYLYGNVPTTQYSDLNGAGNFWAGAWWFRLYWSAFAVLLLVASHLLWRRGTETRLKPRLRRLPARLRGTPGIVAAGALLVFVATGVWGYYNTNVLNAYRTPQDNERYQAEYEKRYLAFEKLPQPTITHVAMRVSLYPHETRAITHGRYRLENLSGRPIREVHVRNPGRDLEIISLDFPGARLARFDKDYGYRIFRLDAPMQPGEVRTLGFVTRRWQRGFRNSGDDHRLVGNGTFLNNFEIAPLIGMNREGVLRERAKRKKYGLPPELRPAKLEDVSATAKSYFGGGWSTADITVATDADQVPVAPGMKVLDRTVGNRRVARFVSDAPILTFFSIQSARYAVRTRMYHGNGPRPAEPGIELAVYYHPAHAWNVDRMLDALQRGLDYYQANFGPYQFRQARIIEFPGYESFAQAFANTMPYSESIGFVADNSDASKIDYVSYVTAHELGHQWWAHQLIGADMQGGTMLSETLAQYSALMVMKHEYGEDQIRRFLKFELDNYLRNRGGEAVEELPLERVEDQGYIHYRKGSLVMYLLQDRLGEDAVNRALRTLLAKYRFKGAPYPRSIDLVQAFRAEAKTPEDQALITDLFERITVYDLKVAEPKAVKRADGRWDVTVPVEAHKFYAGGKGEEKEAALADTIAVGLFTAEPGRGAFDRRNVLLMQRQKVRSGKQVFRFVTAKKPTHAGIDPYNFYIDRNSGDNVAPVT